jgi:uncharacterized protein YqeY
MPCPFERRIQQDIVAAMKSHDERGLSALRMLKSSIQLASTEKGRSGELSDEDVCLLIRRGVKQREEAADIYKKGGAHDRAEDELEEARILSDYLPAQLEDEALFEIIKKAVSESGASGSKDMGRVMGAVMKEVSGRADGKRVREAVGKILS